MRFSIALLGNRIAPRCTTSDGLLFGVMKRGRITYRHLVKRPVKNGIDLINSLLEHDSKTFICGGINNETRGILESNDFTIIPNIAGTLDEVLSEIAAGEIRPGVDYIRQKAIKEKFKLNQEGNNANSSLKDNNSSLDCLNCYDKNCLDNEACPHLNSQSKLVLNNEQLDMLEAATDINYESYRRLCRLSELVYFCLEMNYKKIGIAYCNDLSEPVFILTRVLRRFFEVVPVCCKVKNEKSLSFKQSTSCNPAEQAEILNKKKTEFNIIVGLCIGSDSVFCQLSNAPVSTLFVKDKALANNPIGAVYSDQYLREAANLKSLKVKSNDLIHAEIEH